MTDIRQHRSLSGGAVLLTLIAMALGLGAPAASAAGPPQIEAAWATDVSTFSARLSAEIDPNDDATSYRVEYITEAAYEANLAAARGGFDGALRAPVGSDVSIGSGAVAVEVERIVSGLAPGTAYRYRFVASNGFGATVEELNPAGAPLVLTTRPQASNAPDACPNATARQQLAATFLLDCRAWEMVSPVDKNGGQVDAPGALFGGGVLQAAAGGGAVAYGSAASFGAGAQGAPGASQYIARRTGGGWSTENATVPLFSATFGTGDEGVPYRLFSGGLERALLLNGRHCRGEEGECPVANPPLPGTGGEAPDGYQNYYLRESAGPSFEPLLGPGDIAAAPTAVGPEDFDVSLAGASPNLNHVVLSSCAALTAGATEVPGPDGCDPAQPNLYLHSGGGLTLVNATPPAAIAAPAGAVSAAGERIYWTDGADLMLRDGAATKQADADAGGGGTFEAASADGSVAYFTVAGDLWRYESGPDAAVQIASGVIGVLGASADGEAVYYQDAAGLKLWRSGAGTTTVAPGPDAADPSNFPPATGAARVSADGEILVFVSTEPLTGYDNTDLGTGAPDSQVFRYDADADALACLSCNPTGGRPVGASSIPGATANGAGPDATTAYKPRALAAGGSRVYFDSGDALAVSDTNNDADAYQWEAQGTGTCASPGGCLSLISSGRSEGGATFVDASADGSDAFFRTDRSLVGADPGSFDLYDARVGGGFAEPSAPIPCEGDACQNLPPEPVDPTLTTLLRGLGNPPARYRRYGVRARRRCPKGKRLKTVKTRKGKRVKRCVKKKRSKKRRAHRRAAKRGGRR